MASIFDFLPDRREPAPAAPDQYTSKLLRLQRFLKPPPPEPERPAMGTGSMPEPAAALRPRVVDDGSGLPPVPPAPNLLSPLDKQRAYTSQLENPNDPNFIPVENNDHGWKGRLLDVARQFVISAGQAYNRGTGTPTERLLGAVGGGIAGGAYGGFHPQVDEERQRFYDIGRSKELENTMEGQIGRDLQRQKTQIDIENTPIKTAIALGRLQNARDETERKKIAVGTRIVAGMFKIAADRGYDPADPRQRELTEAIAAYNLPVFAADSKKKISMIQDARTGAWTVALTDPYTSKQEVRPVMGPDGKQLVTTPEAALTYETRKESNEIAQQRQKLSESTFKQAQAALQQKIAEANEIKRTQGVAAAAKYLADIQYQITKLEDPNLMLTEDQKKSLRSTFEKLAELAPEMVPKF